MIKNAVYETYMFAKNLSFITFYVYRPFKYGIIIQNTTFQHLILFKYFFTDAVLMSISRILPEYKIYYVKLKYIMEST